MADGDLYQALGGPFIGNENKMGLVSPDGTTTVFVDPNTVIAGGVPVLDFKGVGEAVGAGFASQVLDGGEMVSSFAIGQIMPYNALLNIDTGVPHKAVFKCSIDTAVASVVALRMRVWNKSIGDVKVADFGTYSLSGDVTIPGTADTLFDVSITITDWKGANLENLVQLEVERILSGGVDAPAELKVRSIRIGPV